MNMKKLIILSLSVLVFAFCFNAIVFAKPAADNDGAYAVAAMAPAGDNIAIGYFDGKIRLYDPSLSKLVKTLDGHSKPIQCVASDILGRFILSSASDGKVILWDAVTGEKLHQKNSPGTSFSACAMDPGGKFSMAGAGASISVWNNNTWENVAIWDGMKDGVYSLSVHYNGNTAAVGGKDGKINIYTLPDGKLIKTLQAGKGEITSLAFAAESDLLISGGYDNTARVWNSSSGKLLKEFSGHTDTVRGVGASAGGLYFVTAGDDGNVFLWDMKTGKMENYLKGGQGSVVALAVDPALRYIAAGIGKTFQKERLVKIWYPSDRFQYRDVVTFNNAQVTISSSGFIDGSGDFADKISIYEGGKKIPYSQAAPRYNKPERMKINLGPGFKP